MARYRPREDRADDVLDLLDAMPRSGLELAEALGVTPAELALIVHPLWHARLLRGEATEGCCQGARGARCRSCRLDRRWCLSEKGASAAKH